MLRDLVEDAAALVSLALFGSMIAALAQAFGA